MSRLKTRFGLLLGVTAALLVPACNSNTPPSATAPKRATSLPQVSSTLHVSGAISGTVTDVRLVGCHQEQAGTASEFYAGVYFKVDQHWYELELIATTRLGVPYSGTNTGYVGPGLYGADVFLRAMDLYAGGMVSAGPAWTNAISENSTLTVSAGERSVAVGSARLSINLIPTSSSNQLELWPVVPGTVGPAPGVTPSPDTVVVVNGSWSCK